MTDLFFKFMLYFSDNLCDPVHIMDLSVMHTALIMLKYARGFDFQRLFSFYNEPHNGPGPNIQGKVGGTHSYHPIIFFITAAMITSLASGSKSILNSFLEFVEGM